MFKVRVIPCLDVKDGRVVKGVNFVNLRDAGDPVELAERYNLPANHTVSANDPNNPGATTVGHFTPGGAVEFQLGSILALKFSPSAATRVVTWPLIGERMANSATSTSR